MYATYHMDCGGCAPVHAGPLIFICPAEGVSELWVESHFLFSLIGCCIVTVDSAVPHGAERPAWACVPRPQFGLPRSQSPESRPLLSSLAIVNGHCGDQPPLEWPITGRPPGTGLPTRPLTARPLAGGGPTARPLAAPLFTVQRSPHNSHRTTVTLRVAACPPASRRST